MSDLLVAGLPVLRGDFLLPRVGAWTADLVLDADSAPSGVVAIESAGGLRLSGFVERVNVTEGRVEVRIRAGRGQLAKELAPVAYRPVGGVRVRTLLEDLARDSGEELSPNTAPEITEAFLAAWSRERGTTARALRALAFALGCSWRFDPSGRFLLVRESWPEVDPDGVTLLRSDPINDAAELGVDAFLAELVPGVSWQGRRVSAAELFVLDGGAHRARLLFEREGDSLMRDRIATKYNIASPHEAEASVYLGTYLARVVAQSADLATVDVEIEPDVAPEKKKIAGLVRVPMYAGTPGEVIELRLDSSSQAFCVVAFLNGDRAKPFVVGWLGSAVNNSGKRSKRTRVRGEEIQLGEGGARKVARDGDPIRITIATGGLTLPVSGGSAANVAPIVLDGTITDGSPTLKTD